MQYLIISKLEPRTPKIKNGELQLTDLMATVQLS
jgi:hypothetical protein